jgi:hypothetical protein
LFSHQFIGSPFGEPIYAHVAAASLSVGVARFATAEWISFKLGFLAPPEIPPDVFFIFAIGPILSEIHKSRYEGVFF